MDRRARGILAGVGVLAGVVCALVVARHRDGGGGANAGVATGVGTREVVETKGETASLPAASREVAVATGPVVAEKPEAVRVGDEVIAVGRRMRRVVTPWAVYVTYWDQTTAWHFKEAGGGRGRGGGGAATQASTQPREAGVGVDAAAFEAALHQKGAEVVSPGEVAWPEVGKLEVVDPEAMLAERFPAGSGPVVRQVGEVVVGVSDVAQAEDGTFFVICTERWAGGGGAGNGAGAGALPELVVREAGGEKGFGVARVAEVAAPFDAAAIRVVFAMVVPADPVGAGKNVRFELAVSGAGASGPAPVEVALKAETTGVTLREAAGAIYDLCAAYDGIAPVTVSRYRRAAGGAGGAGLEWQEARERLGEFTGETFLGEVLRELAERHAGK